MSHRLATTLAMLAGLAATISAEEPPLSLFDGKTLAGWHIMPSEDEKYHAVAENFFVKDGALHCFQLKNKNGGLLLSDGTYQDFELEMEIKSDWGCDSGIFVRCNENGEGIQILNDYLEDGCVGFPFGQGTGGYISRPIRLYNTEGNVTARDVYNAVEKDKLIYAIDALGWNIIWKHGDWNTIKIRCTGAEPKITTWVNGVKIMEMDGSTYAARGLNDEKVGNWSARSAWDQAKVLKTTGGSGSIGVQIHPGGRWAPGGSAMYRNIRVKELN